MNRSEQINEIATALAKAQGEMKAPSKNCTLNLHGREYKYADLSKIIEATKEPLSKNGLCVTQLIDGDSLVTMLVHSSGQFIASFYPLFKTSKAHEMGSQLTYGKRYSLSSILCIASDDDEDGTIANNAPEADVPNFSAVTHKPSQSAAAGSAGPRFNFNQPPPKKDEPVANQVGPDISFDWKTYEKEKNK
jgi:hypothetical protein